MPFSLSPWYWTLSFGYGGSSTIVWTLVHSLQKDSTPP